jgi:hypothetical protein
MSKYTDKSVRKLLAEIRKLSRIGNGPCGGGGMLDEFHNGVRHTEGRVRKKCKEILEEFKQLNEKSSNELDHKLKDAVYSAQYILEELNEINSQKALADRTGLPLGVIVDAFDNIFNPDIYSDKDKFHNQSDE